ncbi:MAG: ABC transporter ATP-binding protein [Acetobacteraceae bacterium]|nr:ABC transporter ATP-binding protein [Acetobacteraceae bacterium]
MHAEPGAGTAITVEGLTVVADRGATHILQDVSVQVGRGEMLGVIGESGAGKSTLGSLLLGYLAPGCQALAGRIVFDSRDLLRMRESERRQLRGTRIAYVAQSSSAAFNPAYRIIDQHIEVAVQHGLASRSHARQDAVRLHHELGLPADAGERFAHQLSGGQLQRAMIAMAISCRPELVVFDEPTTGLDVTTQLGVLRVIRDVVRRHGMSGVYISHDLALVAQMADRIAVMRHGRLVEIAETAAMLAAPKAEYTRSLWAVRNLAKAAVPPAAGVAPLLSLRGVEARYGPVPVLRGIDLDVPPGRSVVIVGESGSGKSTLARVICGLLPPGAGRIRFAGRDLAPSFARRSRQDLRRIQMIYQMADTALNPRQTVRTAIGRPLVLAEGLRGATLDARVRGLMAEIELDAVLADRPTAILSGGQKQRVAIARALAAGPTLLICDEVTSALDQIVAHGVLTLLRRLQEEKNLSLLFITHDLGVARAIGDWIVVMRQGEIVEQGPAASILTSPAQEYTRNLLASVPEMQPGWLDRVLERSA